MTKVNEKEIQTVGSESDEEEVDGEFEIPRKKSRVNTKLPPKIDLKNRYSLLNNINTDNTQFTHRSIHNKERLMNKIPPLIIPSNQNISFEEIKTILRENKFESTTIQSKRNTFIVETKNKDEFTILKTKLKEIQFYTFTCKDERENVFVGKGITADTEMEEISNHLKNLTDKVSWFNKKINNWIVVRTSKDINLNTLNQLVPSMNYSKIKWEILQNKKVISQCHRCQAWGHTTLNCNLNPKCLKCGEDHWTRLCDKTDSKKCANCKKDHFANSTECEKYQIKLKLKEEANQKALNKYSNTKRPNTFKPAPTTNPWQIPINNENQNQGKKNNPMDDIEEIVKEIKEHVNLNKILKELTKLRDDLRKEKDPHEREVLFKFFMFGR